MRKFMSVILSALVILTMSVTAFATDASVKGVPGVTAISGRVPAEPSYYAKLDGASRSLEVPTQSHNLSSGSYHADLDHVQAHWLYTNKYFYPSSAGRINVSYNVQSDGAYGSMRIGIYDCTTNKMVNTWDTENTSGEISGSIGFRNLDTMHKYAVAFISRRYSTGSLPKFTGTATIYH